MGGKKFQTYDERLTAASRFVIDIAHQASDNSSTGISCQPRIPPNYRSLNLPFCLFIEGKSHDKGTRQRSQTREAPLRKAYLVFFLSLFLPPRSLLPALLSLRGWQHPATEVMVRVRYLGISGATRRLLAVDLTLSAPLPRRFVRLRMRAYCNNLPWRLLRPSSAQVFPKNVATRRQQQPLSREQRDPTQILFAAIFFSKHTELLARNGRSASPRLKIFFRFQNNAPSPFFFLFYIF